MWNFICWIVLGAVAGGIANSLMANKTTGCFGNIVLGIVGSIFGGWVGSLIGFRANSPFSLKGCFIAVIGACLLIFISRIINKK